MSRLRTKVLLEECIKEVLKEEYAGAYGDYAGLGLDPMQGNPFGVHWASQEDLYKIFIKPFTDVVGVAAGKTKELSVKAQTLLKVVFENVMTSLIPLLSSNYSDIFREEKKRLDKIKSEYANVYNATWEAFNEADVMIAAFMYRPDLFLTAKLAQGAPELAKHLLSVLSGGAMDDFLSHLSTPSMKSHGGSHSRAHGRSQRPHLSRAEYERRLSNEAVIREDDSEQEESGLVKALKNKELRQKIAENPKVKELGQIGQQITNDTLNKVIHEAQTVLGSKSLEDLTHKLGKQIKGMEKLAQLPEQERAQASQNILATAKKSMKEFYTKQLQAHVKSAVDSGLSSDHPFVQAYASAISKIKGM